MKKTWNTDNVRYVSTMMALSVVMICATVGGIVSSNNKRAVEERRLDDEAATRAAELDARKRKIWERDAKHVPDE